MNEHDFYMREALHEAKKAAKINEVPVGAVIVRRGKIIARAHNLKEKKGNALLHAELIAIKKASRAVRDWRLCECDIYITLEPCPMCAGALINARVNKIFFGAYDEKWGCCGSLYNLPADTRFNWRPEVLGGILQDECAAILKDYFKRKRADAKCGKDNKKL